MIFCGVPGTRGRCPCLTPTKAIRAVPPRQEGRSMNRRILLWMLGVGAGVAVATQARADRMRILPDVRAGEPASGGDQVDADLQRFLDGARVGDRRAHGRSEERRGGDEVRRRMW